MRPSNIRYYYGDRSAWMSYKWCCTTASEISTSTLNTDESLNHQFIEINADESLHGGEPHKQSTLTTSIIRNFGIIIIILTELFSYHANIQNKENRDMARWKNYQ